MVTLQFADTHNMVVFFSKPTESDGFEQIVWSTDMAKTINEEAQLHAKVDGKKIIVTESSVRRDLRLADEEDEVVHKELGDRLVRAVTNASSLEAEHDSGNITKTQSKATPNEPSSQGINSGGGPSVHDEVVSNDPGKEMFDVDVLGCEEMFVAWKNENVVKEVVDAAQVSTAATTVTITTKEITLVQALKALKTLKPKKRRKRSAAKRAEEKRNKPPTKAQQRKIMCTYQKNMKGYTLKELKLFKFDRIQEMFDRAFRRVNTFEDFRTELVEGKEKRAGEELYDGNEVGQNAVQNPGIQIVENIKGLSVVLEITNQYGNGNVKTAPAKDAYAKTERVKVNCTSEDTLQQASTSRTQSDNTPVYDSNGSTEQCLVTANHDVCVLNYVNYINSLANNQSVNVSIRENQKKHKANAKKLKELGPKGSLASSRPSEPRTYLRWISTRRIFSICGKLTASSNTENKSEKSVCDNASTSNPSKPSSKGFSNSASLLGRLSRLRKHHTSIYPIVVL
nr:hypothetical protein [Tanacetum cinerariifolium]